MLREKVTKLAKIMFISKNAENLKNIEKKIKKKTGISLHLKKKERRTFQ